jgi:hypothetical protein
MRNRAASREVANRTFNVDLRGLCRVRDAEGWVLYGVLIDHQPQNSNDAAIVSVQGPEPR